MWIGIAIKATNYMMYRTNVRNQKQQMFLVNSLK